MAARARILHQGRTLFVHIDDPAVDPKVLGPLGNYVRVDYNTSGNRVKYEAAVRGYGPAGHDLVERAVRLADIAAGKLDIAQGGPREKTQRFTADI